MSQNAPVFTALNYLFSIEGTRTVAHCLDLDLVTSAPSIEAAEASLNALVIQQIRTCFVTGNYSQLEFKAPSEYWQKHEHAKLLETVRLAIEVPPVVLPVDRKFSVAVTRTIQELKAA